MLFMNPLDYVVLLGSMLGIAAYGMWRTRGATSSSHYLRGEQRPGWLTIGLSVMATQASAITFLSTPGQGFESGLGFVQNYFGMPLALIIIAAVFLPIYRRLECLYRLRISGPPFRHQDPSAGRGDCFSLQRGLAAGITIYAPAIILSTVSAGGCDLTIILQRTAGDHLYRRRRQRGGEPHPEISDGRDLRRHGGGVCHPAA